jgi:hypothetical protein
MRRALAFGIDRDTIVVALAGFLLRGGIVLLLVPSVVLPSVIGVAGVIGVNAFGIDGRPTAWLFEIVAIGSTVAAAWLMLAAVVGSLVDVWLIEAALDPEERSMGQPRELPDLRVLLDMAAIRAVCMLPLAAAIAWASSRLYTAAYNELTTPTNLATPLAVRVVESAADGVVVVGLAWLLSEVVAGVAVRRLVLLDRGVWRSIAGALAQLVRRPLSSAFTVALSYGASIVATGLAIAASATAFDWCLVAARNQVPIAMTIGAGSLSTTRDFRPAVFILATVVLAVAWVAAVALSGIASAWRSAAFTLETSDAAGDVGASSERDRLGRSGATAEIGGFTLEPGRGEHPR